MLNKATLSAIIKTASTFLVLLAVVFALCAKSFGWFAENKDVDATGMSVGVEGIKVEISRVESSDGTVTTNQGFAVAFKEICPGDTVKVKITVSCYKQLEALSISLDAPENCETPVTVDGNNYYFGSQIIISSFTYNGTAVSNSAVGKSLFGDTPESDWGTTEQLTPTSIDLYSFAPLTVGDHVFEIEFTFFNASYNQNVLKDFGKTEGQICYRQFKIQ